MFLTFTPNPCFERTLQIADFAPNSSRRLDIEAVAVSAGGKGFNAARVAARFGAEVVALAPVGRRQIAWMSELCARDGVGTAFVPVENDTRVCLNILHRDAASQAAQNTEIIENGAPLSLQNGTALLDKWRDLLPHAQLAAIGGAYPPGCAPGFELHAALLCEMAARAGVPVIYDGRGAEFSRALASAAPPWAIKPNLEEAAMILGRTIETVSEERRAVRDLRSRGAEVVLLSCGARGLYLGHAGGIEWSGAPRVEAVSSVGCGDALVGAFAAHHLAGAGLIETARWGVAAGSASAANALPAQVFPGEAAALLAQVSHQSQGFALHSG